MRHLLAALTIPFAISSFAFDIVKDGKATTEIVVQEELARHVEFFCAAVKKCTGATLPQVSAPTEKLNRITFKLEQRSPFAEDAYDITFPDAKTMLITGSRYSVRWALNIYVFLCMFLCVCLCVSMCLCVCLCCCGWCICLCDFVSENAFVWVCLCPCTVAGVSLGLTLRGRGLMVHVILQ